MADAKRSFDVAQVVLVGRVARAELKKLGSGQSVLAFAVAVNRIAGEKEYVSFVPCEVWGKYAEMLEAHVTKGARVTVVGELRSRTWEQDGKKREALEVTATNVTFWPSGESRPKASSPSGGADYPPPGMTDEIPF